MIRSDYYSDNLLDTLAIYPRFRFRSTITEFYDEDEDRHNLEIFDASTFSIDAECRTDLLGTHSIALYQIDIRR